MRAHDTQTIARKERGQPGAEQWVGKGTGREHGKINKHGKQAAVGPTLAHSGLHTKTLQQKVKVLPDEWMQGINNSNKMIKLPQQMTEQEK